ncbi:MAG: site-specific integrase, partial [Mycetocola sp.]
MEIARAVDNYLDSVIEADRLSAHTVTAYAADLGGLTSYLKDNGAESTEDINLESLRDWLWFDSQRGLSAATLSRHRAAVRGFGEWLADRGIVDANPAARLKAPAPGRTLPQLIHADRIDSAVTALRSRADEGDHRAGRDLCIIELLYATGMRVSELVALDTGDINL